MATHSGASRNIGRKKRKITSSTDTNTATDSKIAYFDELPDDLVVDIISKLGATASCPAHFFSLLLTCKRMNELGIHPTVLSKVTTKVFTCSATNWGLSAAKFLQSCALASNVDALYTVGMTMVYCYGNTYREMGEALIEKAALMFHPDANYSLSVMMFNARKSPEVGVIHAACAALLGHIDATYELGYCLEDGYGIKQNVAEGRLVVLQARARAVASTLPPGSVGGGPDWIAIPVPKTPVLGKGRWVRWLPRSHLNQSGPVTEASLISGDFPWDAPEPELHPVHRFLTEWFADQGGDPGEGRKLCSREGCGLPETRVHEFRRCPMCWTVSYCSRVCYKTDWKRRHRVECTPVNGGEIFAQNGLEDVDGEENVELVGILEEEVAGEGDLVDQ